MSDSADNPLLNDRAKRAGKPAFGATALRLYRNDAVWRGALDMIVVGTTIMLLSQGFPDLFKEFNNLFRPGSTGPAASAPLSDAVPLPAGAAGPSANFSTPANVQPPVQQASPLPKPAPKKTFPKVWIGNPSDEDKATLERALNLIGINNDQARELLETKAEAGEPNYQSLMGGLHVNEALQNKSSDKMAKAVFLYKEAAGQGHPAAQYELGQIYRLGNPDVGIEMDYQEAIKWYLMAVDNPLSTDGEAENQLGRLYERGAYVPQDYQKAKDYYMAGAKKGSSMAAGNLGAIYLNHPAGGQDAKQGLYWTQKAAEEGGAMAQRNMAALCLQGGLDGRPDYPQFLKWAGLAVDQGDVSVMLQLGDFYSTNNPGFPQNKKMAAKYYRLAALKKDPKGQFMLGQMYETGAGMPEDKIQAYVYYNLSYKDGGYPPAYAQMQTLKSKMTAAELEYADKMAAALVPTEGSFTPKTTFAGIGVATTHRNGHILVVDVLPGTPAEQAGLKKGEEILQINGVPSSTLDTRAASTLLRGPVGTEVRLLLQAPNAPATHEMSVKRRMINP
jgi:TPR repeat protein